MKARHENSFMRKSEKLTNRWVKYAASFVLPDVDLDELAARPKQSKNEMAKALAIVAEMESWPSDACSGRWKDKNGKLMVAYFADRGLPGEVSAENVILDNFLERIFPRH